MTSPLPPKRLDQAINEKLHQALQDLLASFPDLRSAAIVLDYHLDDKGALPDGYWLSAGPLSLRDRSRFCLTFDKFSYHLRTQYEDALGKWAYELEELHGQEERNRQQPSPPEPV